MKKISAVAIFSVIGSCGNFSRKIMGGLNMSGIKGSFNERNNNL